MTHDDGIAPDSEAINASFDDGMAPDSEAINASFDDGMAPDSEAINASFDDGIAPDSEAMMAPDSLVPEARRSSDTPLGIMESYYADGRWWVAMRRHCEEIGLDWSAQRKRIRRHELLSTGFVAIVEQRAFGPREVLCLRRDYWWLWLSTIELSRLENDALRATIVEVLRVGYEAISAALEGQQAARLAPPPPRPALPAPTGDAAQLAAQVQHLQAQVAQLARGGHATRRSWGDATPGPRRTLASGREVAPWLSDAAIYAVFHAQPDPTAPLPVSVIAWSLKQSGWDVNQTQVRVYVRRMAEAGLLVWPARSLFALPPVAPNVLVASNTEESR